MKIARKLFLFSLLVFFSFVARAEEARKPEEFFFSGGSGRVTICCSTVTWKDDEPWALLVFSSPHYTVVRVDGGEYVCESDGECSKVRIPVKLNGAFEISAVTTAMSRPHEIRYTLYIGFQRPEDFGLACTGELVPEYAEGFSARFFEGGYTLLEIRNEGQFLLLPAEAELPSGLPPDVTILRKPISRAYLAATSAMAFFVRLDALDALRFSGAREDDWDSQVARDAMKAGDLLFAGKYSEPDYERLLKDGCDLAIESTMILHAPKVREMLELLGIPVLIDRSSYERSPLGRVEWILFYGLLTDRLDQAQEFFSEQKAMYESLIGEKGPGGTVAFFYLRDAGTAVVRGGDDYIARVIDLGGGAYLYDDLGEESASSVSIPVTIEDFYDRASQADFLIYNGALDESVESLADLEQKSPLLSGFRAVREGRVYLAGDNLYQATDRVVFLIADVRNMLAGRDERLVFLKRLS